MQPIELACYAAREAGQILLNSIDQVQSVHITSKKLHDFVTHIDIESEKLIIGLIKKEFPNHSIMAEEAGEFIQQAQYRWIIDPLDGTINYIHQVPTCAISIAFENNAKRILGVIYDPFRDELFSAESGKGAYLNDKPIKVSQSSDLDNCLFATGFPFKHYDLLDLYLKIFSKIFQKVSGIRRCGAAALDLAYVACGRFDGFWEMKLNPWDMAAGEIIVTEAGGKVTDLKGEKNYMNSGNIIATNDYIHTMILNILKETGVDVNEIL